MNPPCARCKKTVYPVEKLNCLDKTWHKPCFSCEVCNIKLTMKTYKGYNKLPYCNTHYPTTKFTSVADTPENKRLQQQSRNQSELVYRKDKEEMLKHFTQVESKSSQQSRQQQALASNIGYHTSPHDVDRAPQTYHSPPQSVTQMPPMQQPPAAPPTSSGSRYVAVYDYTAADEDEVSFKDGDIIVDGTVIDEGWMEGTVQRTGERGMLPSNYVQKM